MTTLITAAKERFAKAGRQVHKNIFYLKIFFQLPTSDDDLKWAF